MGKELAADVLMAELPIVETSIYADTGHLPLVQHTARFNAELAAFAEKVGAR